jgi:hypothetical protein
VNKKGWSTKTHPRMNEPWIHTLREARHKMQHIVEFYLWEMSKTDKIYSDWQQISGCLGFGGGWVTVTANVCSVWGFFVG